MRRHSRRHAGGARALVLACLVLLASRLSAAPAADHQPHGTVHALRAAHPPAIDGRLTEESWVLAEPASTFTQTDPDEGQSATERTEVRVLFDDDALYVGVALFDSQPGAVVRRLVKRDEDADADRVTVYLDPMHDHLTGAYFRVSASGVQKDAAVFNDSWDDASWDAVWESAVSSDANGWSAELRIPLSQLRFQRGEQAVWGINVARYVQRKNETDWLEPAPKSQNGVASRMAHLVGLDGIEPKRHAQLLPYVASRAEFIGNGLENGPFNDGSRLFGAAGMDMKWSISSHMTLDATVNPDFGQVEVDPAVVNLTAFETFFEERRPFFLEGAQIFQNFGRSGANNYWGFNSSDPNIFYSRRIGRTPQLTASGDYVDTPAASTILSAAKVTGKTRSGWTVGLLDAITDSEMARTASGSVLDRVQVEPRTNYLVGRLQHEIGRRAGIGFIATSSTRKLDTPALRSTLAEQATVAGGEGHWFLGSSRDWVVNGRLAFSRISGEPDAIARSQKLSQRYFQRPDAPQVSYDPTRTSLTGFTGRANLNRNSGLWQVNASIWGVSPGFESNDLGFLNQADRSGAHIVLMRRKVTPDRFTRSRSIWVAKSWVWNFGRDMQSDGVHGNAFVTFRNYWTASGGGNVRRTTQDDRLTRGGVSALNPRTVFWNASASSDPRRGVSVQFIGNGMSNRAGGWSNVAGTTVTLKPTSQLMFVVGPQLTRSLTSAQYVQTVTDPTATATFGRRDVFGLLDQTQLQVTLRANAVLTPHVSVQVFAQPLLASGDYYGLGELSRPRSYDFLRYGGRTSSLTYDPLLREYTADPDRDGPAPSFTIDDPDFNLKSLRLNAVFRWEFRPGSALYVVWTRQQLDESSPGQFDLARDTRALLSAQGDDVFMVKFAYWLSR